ncbi:oligosaccharide flippase family protein [Nocardioides sp. GCM10027113]|uniref:oligosaccharide flippase family protein n=1 Tax=unclassified Nocardioides TaxID=2615069 RepID=UPI00361D84DB
MSKTRRSLPPWLVGAGSIAVAIGLMNLGTYGYTIIAARLLGPGSYGAFASLMAALLVVSVLPLGLQATAARRISAEPERVGEIEYSILRVTYRAAIGVGAVCLLLTPVINLVLRLDNLTIAALVAVTAAPMTVMGGQAGILQGERRWVPLALLYVANGVPRLLIGTSLLLWQPSELNAVLGVVLGQFVPCLVGWHALRHRRQAGKTAGDHATRPVLREAVHNSQALFAYFALSNVDVVVARNVLDDRAAGLYAGGLILTKAVLFLPQFVVVLAFPAMSSTGARRRALGRALGLVAVLGAAAVGGAWLLPELALVFVGGDDYSDIQSRLWLFAVLGTALAMLQLLVYSVVARQGRRSVYVIWLALATLIAIGSTATSLGGLLARVLTVDLTLLVLLAGTSLVLLRSPAPTDDSEPADAPR